MIGFMWEYDRARPLGWKEYKYWMLHPLPFGWSVICEPEKGIEPTQEHDWMAAAALRQALEGREEL